MTDEWNKLDGAALANLRDTSSFHRTKAQLKAEGVPWADAREVLEGLIWDEAEAQDEWQDTDLPGDEEQP